MRSESMLVFCFVLFFFLVWTFSSLMQPKGQATNPLERWMTFPSKTKGVSLSKRKFARLDIPTGLSCDTRVGAAGFLGRPGSNLRLLRSTSPNGYAVLW